MRVSTGSKYFLCDNCGKDFKDGNEWKRHAGKCGISKSRWI